MLLHAICEGTGAEAEGGGGTWDFIDLKFGIYMRMRQEYYKTYFVTQSIDDQNFQD